MKFLKNKMIASERYIFSKYVELNEKETRALDHIAEWEWDELCDCWIAKKLDLRKGKEVGIEFYREEKYDLPFTLRKIYDEGEEEWYIEGEILYGPMNLRLYGRILKRR